ncbi:MAG TPA: hypothetical protein VGR92_15545 [Steroidobacteraceae bacterium]|nr:hypothetical protein [Steroidobacteraceae bacterium]
MKSTPLTFLCCGLAAGVLFFSSGPAVAGDAAARPHEPHPPAAEVITYPAPAGILASPLYSVRLGRSSSMRNSFVYQVDNIGLAQYNWQGHGWNIRSELTTAWTSFDFRGSWRTLPRPGSTPVTVQVNMVIPAPAWTQPAVRVLPSAYGVRPSAVTQVGNTYQVTFTLDSAGQYSVEFYDAAAAPDFATWVPPNPLLIFANPIEKRVPRLDGRNVLVLRPGQAIPPPGAWGTRDGITVDTLYFSPGVYDLGQVPSIVNTGIYTLHSNQHVYLAGGAYVKGAFETCPDTPPTPCRDATNVSIRGRGILSGENFRRDYTASETNSNANALDAPMLIDFEGSGVVSGVWVGQQNALVAGITLIQAPYYNMTLNGINNRVDNVKLISWYPSTDGIVVGYDYKVQGVEHPGGGALENSFFKDGDDSVKLYSSGLRVRNVVVWQSNNAAAFELGAPPNGADDVRVVDSNVIHGEWSWPNMNNAVFAEHQSSRALLGQIEGYHFERINVENTSWQLMQIAVGPSIWEFGNTQLGAAGRLFFSDIFVTDPQTLPNELQSYDQQHEIAGVHFHNVVVAGQVLGTPPITFDANRMFSLQGNIMSSPMWAERTGAVVPNVQAWNMIQGTPSSSPISAIETLDQPLFENANLQAVAYGDFFGDGYASPLIVDTANRILEVWKEPLNPALSSQPSPLLTLGTLPAGYQFAGVGDFNDSGTIGVVLWSSSAQQALVLVMGADGQLLPLTTLQPAHASTWSVAGVGDFDKNGYSDVLLRDAAGNLELIYLGPGGPLTTLDLAPGRLFYTATKEYQANNPGKPTQGHFDTNWQVAGVGTMFNDYADILWTDPATGDVGMTELSPVIPQRPVAGALMASLPPGSQIQGLGDYNGDGAMDILYRNPVTGEVGIWYLGWMGGNYLQQSPTVPVTVGKSWQLLGH